MVATPTLPQSTDSVPRLHNGDHLNRFEFARRYEADPDVRRAELIEGVVYMSSPVSHDHHGVPHAGSFDIDSLDPSEAPSTGTICRGGLSFREAHYICESLAATGRLGCALRASARMDRLPSARGPISKRP